MLGSARPSVCHEPHDRKQRNRAEERDKQSEHADIALIDVCSADYRAQHPSAEQRADAAHHDVQEDSLPSISAHDLAGDPADESTDDEK